MLETELKEVLQAPPGLRREGRGHGGREKFVHGFDGLGDGASVRMALFVTFWPFLSPGSGARRGQTARTIQRRGLERSNRVMESWCANHTFYLFFTFSLPRNEFGAVKEGVVAGLVEG